MSHRDHVNVDYRDKLGRIIFFHAEITYFILTEVNSLSLICLVFYALFFPQVVHQVYQMPFYHPPEYTSTWSRLHMWCLPHSPPSSSLVSILADGAQAQSHPQSPSLRLPFASLLWEPASWTPGLPLLDAHLVLPKDVGPKKEYMEVFWVLTCLKMF